MTKIRDKTRMREIGTRVQMSRLYRRMKQCELADALSVTRAQMCRYEKGVTGISPDMLLKIANILNMSLESFFKPLPVSLELFEGEDKNLNQK